jgi:UDPglucose 6-dehydrogenase
MNIGVVGLGKLGSVLAVLLANAGHAVAGIDTDEGVYDRLASSTEPGFAELWGSLDGQTNLTIDSSYEALQGCSLVFIVTPTPSLPDGSFDASTVVSAATQAALGAGPLATIVVSSTVSPGACDKVIVPAVREVGPCPVAYSPFFIALGSVVHDMQNPDMVLIGASDEETHKRVGDVLATIVGGVAPLFLDPGPTVATPEEARALQDAINELAGDSLRAMNQVIVTPPGVKVYPTRRFSLMSLLEAETTKLALNCYLSLKIGFSILVTEVCDAVGADAYKVLDAIGLDSRIGPKLLKPGGPAAGPCLPRDLRAMERWLGHDLGIDPYFVTGIAAVNRDLVCRVVDWCRQFDSVAILGLSYKPGSAVTDESLGIQVADALRGKARVITWDPMTTGRLPTAVPKTAINLSDAVLIATAWPEFVDLDTMGKPCLDVWGILKPQPGVKVLGRP